MDFLYQLPGCLVKQLACPELLYMNSKSAYCLICSAKSSEEVLLLLYASCNPRWPLIKIF